MNLLGMFARKPQAGESKTRLAASIGDTAATELYAAFVEDLLHRCPVLADYFVVCATPQSPAADDWFRSRMSDNTSLVWQPNGSLGDRIEWFFDHAAGQGSDRAVLIGSDSPDLPSSIISSAFKQLDQSDMVIAPAADGGFVLIGLRTPQHDLFQNVSWSTPSTLLDTLNAAEKKGLSVSLIQPWYDIDTLQSIGTLQSLQRVQGAGNEVCPQTQAALSRWDAGIQAAMAESSIEQDLSRSNPSEP